VQASVSSTLSIEYVWITTSNCPLMEETRDYSSGNGKYKYFMPIGYMVVIVSISYLNN